MKQAERTRIGNRISKITIFWNLLLSFIKLLAGIIGRSSAMIADGVHSLSDIISTVAVMIGLHMAQKPEDDDHPYGHEKIEPVIAKILATILFITALGIGYDGIHRIKLDTYQTPGMVTLYTAILSIIIKEWMYRYTIKGAKKLDSSALLADAWHHRSDVFSSIGTLIAITGARFGYPILDPIASLVISLLIIKVSLEIYKQSINQLVDYAGDKDTIEQIRADISVVKGVIEINTLKTRIHANKIYVDVAIAVDGNLSVIEGHQIARKVHDKIEDNNTYKVKHCMVHVDPYHQGKIS
jgi:cation diffusion facilitator family transporter